MNNSADRPTPPAFLAAHERGEEIFERLIDLMVNLRLPMDETAVAALAAKISRLESMQLKIVRGGEDLDYLEWWNLSEECEKIALQELRLPRTALQFVSDFYEPVWPGRTQ